MINLKLAEEDIELTQTLLALLEQCPVDIRSCAKLRGRLVLAFCAGPFKERVLELLRNWEVGAAAAGQAAVGEGGGAGAGAMAGVEAGSGSAGMEVAVDRPPPLKFQLWGAMVAQLVVQGVVDPVKTTLLSTPISAVEAVQYRIPSEPSDLPFMFTMLFKPNLEGLAARAALDSASVRNAIAKGNGTWPELGIKAGRFRPGQLHSEVLQGLGHSPRRN